MTEYFYLLMSQFNFLRHWVVIEQHAPLDIVEVYLESKTTLFDLFKSSWLNLNTLKWLKVSESESVYFFTNPQRWPQKTILSSCQQGLKPWVKVNKCLVWFWKMKHTLCTLMEGNMFWNMVAMSLTCMPSDPKLLRMSSGWWVNCCSCILCFFRDETTSLIREYWKKGGKYEKTVAFATPQSLFLNNVVKN